MSDIDTIVSVTLLLDFIDRVEIELLTSSIYKPELL